MRLSGEGGDIAGAGTVPVIPTCLHTATFVGSVVGFLDVFTNTPAEPPPCRRGSLMTGGAPKWRTIKTVFSLPGSDDLEGGIFQSNWYTINGLASGHLLLPVNSRLDVTAKYAWFQLVILKTFFS